LVTQRCRRRQPVQLRGLFLLADLCRSSHTFRGTDQIIGRFEVEEVQILKLVVLWRLEHVNGDTVGVPVFVRSVEEVEQKLQPFEDDVDLLARKWALLGELIGKRRDEEGFDGG
jgi:hypothetical protein